MDDAAMTLIESIVLQLPNFAGLTLALILLLRQNNQLTNALISISKDCDCRDAVERRLDAEGKNIPRYEAQTVTDKPAAAQGS